MTIGELREQIRNIDDSFEILIENYDDGKIIKLKNCGQIDLKERIIILWTELI